MLRLAAAFAALLTAPAHAEIVVPAPIPAEAMTFDEWAQGFRQRARAEGISQGALAALDEVRLLPDVIELDRNQYEFSKTIWVYLQTAVSDARINNGRAALDRHGALFDRVEARYGVDRHILAAIWGLESAYGAVRGNVDTLSALASLAYDGRRGAFFEGELIAALRILDAGDAAPGDLRGSWAGAMGHTQFMPSSFLALAVDSDGDGRRHIWGDDPADALASAANFLANAGWQSDLPWGYEVAVPDGFDYRLADRRISRGENMWAALGITLPDGSALPRYGRASLLLPAGAEGAAFLIYANFAALEHYNTADAYVVAVGHLADRIRGGGPIVSDWPLGDRALTFDERTELQERLTAAGFDTLGIDGLIGPLTINAIRDYQSARGLTPDGYAPPALLERLRAEG